MKKIPRASVPVVLIVLAALLIGGTAVQAGTKDMDATKRNKFKDDSAQSMQDVFTRRETEDKEYKEIILANSNKTVELLKEIKNLLHQLNSKE